VLRGWDILGQDRSLGGVAVYGILCGFDVAVRAEHSRVVHVFEVHLTDGPFGL
jgi:hypothetical protein